MLQIILFFGSLLCIYLLWRYLWRSVWRLDAEDKLLNLRIRALEFFSTCTDTASIQLGQRVDSWLDSSIRGIPNLNVYYAVLFPHVWDKNPEVAEYLKRRFATEFHSEDPVVSEFVTQLRIETADIQILYMAKTAFVFLVLTALIGSIFLMRELSRRTTLKFSELIWQSFYKGSQAKPIAKYFHSELIEELALSK